MEKKYLNDDQEMRYILRQFGFGAVLGHRIFEYCISVAFLAQCVGNF